MNPFSKIEVADTVTPKTPKHDWRTERWVDERGPTECDMYTAFGIVTALAMDGDDPQDEEDKWVFGLLRPDIMEQVWKGPGGDQVVRARLVQAVAQNIKMVREHYAKVRGLN